MSDLSINIDLSNPEFQLALRLLKETNANVFLTGRAGTGKSTFLRYICQNIKKNYVVLAPTGVAAVNVGGVTIHSFFQMPLRPVPPDDPDYSVASFRKSGKFNRRKRKLIKELDLIIIDEVSMVRPDMIDFIDRALRGMTGHRGKPFGGVQLLLIGDIFQLEPVVNPDTRLILSKYYKDFFFFNALAYQQVNLVAVELNRIYRQTDPVFISLLDRVRLNSVSSADISTLNLRVDNRHEELSNSEFGITLTTRRDSAAIINKERMDSLPGEEFIFQGEIEDDFPEKLLPTDLNLVLKKDAQVMMIRNDKDRRWVNGTLARVRDISKAKITIALEDGREETVEREVWENITYSYDEKEKKVIEEVIGRFTQFPLKAAWALTIHKSQGLTFNKVAIDMSGGAFSAGQTYVALSRCRSLEGLSFSQPISRRDVIVSRGAKDFSRSFNDQETAKKVLRETRAAELSKQADKEFANGNYIEAIEKLTEIHGLTSALKSPAVRRLVASRLNVISSMQRQIEEKNRKLSEVSGYFLKEGEECLSGNEVRKAEAAFLKALDLDEENYEARLGLAKCSVALGNRQSAIDMLDKLAKGPKELRYKALILKARIYEEADEYANAALIYTAAYKLKKSNTEPIERLISLYEKAGMDELADEYRGWLEEITPA